MWDESSADSEKPLASASAAELEKLQSCREIGRVLKISRPDRSVEVEVTTQSGVQILKYDLVKFGSEFVPCPGEPRRRID